MFFVYVDWTIEPVPRVFYVGKGDDERVAKKDRNSDWKVIAQGLGWRREVVYATHDEDDAYTAEKWLVSYHNTFHGWGANLNEGGRGQKSGWHHAENAKARISESLMGHAPWSRGRKNPTAGPKLAVKMKGRVLSDETKQKMRLSANHRPPLTVETRAKMQHAKLGIQLSQDHKNHISRSLMNHRVTQETKNQITQSQPHKRRVCQTTLTGDFVAIHESIKAAVRNTAITNVGPCCRGTRKSAGGYVWWFVSEEHTND